MSDQKLEQAEWEVVDTMGPQAPPQATRAAMMRAMLGPWWRWKIAATILVMCMILALVFALAGVFFVVGLAVVLVSLVVAKVRQMLRQGGRSLTR
ncbi:MAG: hypothetical protein ABWY05_11555 [Noviherbaspirillum sp.]